MNAITKLERPDGAAAQEPGGPQAAPSARRFPGERRRRVLRLAAVALVLVVAAGAVTPWLMNRWSHVSIDDSRIAAGLITVSSEVSGRVTAVAVASGERVTKGQLLVSLDRDELQLGLQSIDAQIDGIDAHRSQLRAQQQMIRSQVASKVAAGKAQIASAEAVQASRKVSLETARSKLERLSSLAGSNVVSQQALDDARADLARAEQEELAASAATDTARANLDVVRSEEAQIGVLDRQIDNLDAQKAALAVSREQKRIELERREIRAGFDGVIDAVFIDPGEFAAPGLRLLIYHDPEKVWVDANVKETDFARLKLGARTTVTVDAYPGMEFEGRVIRLGTAATSQFALLPSPNPSGNFTKVTHRLPIRVSIDQRDDLLKPGMMVELSIDAH